MLASCKPDRGKGTMQEQIFTAGGGPSRPFRPTRHGKSRRGDG